jgi:hypothetical protein
MISLLAALVDAPVAGLSLTGKSQTQLLDQQPGSKVKPDDDLPHG